MKRFLQTAQAAPFVLITLALLSPISRAESQEIPARARVRVTYDAERGGISRITRGSDKAVVGIFIGSDSAGYAVRNLEGDRIVPRALVRRIEVSDGKHRNVAQGALLGAGSSAAAMLLLHFALVAPLGGTFEDNSKVYLMIPAGGAILGAAAYYAFPQERWRRVR